MIFDTPNKSFWQELLGAARRSTLKKPNDIILPFAELDGGFTIKFYVEYKPKQIDGKPSKVPEYKDFSFTPRAPGLYKGVEVYPLDTYLIVKSAEELQSIMYGNTVPQETPTADDGFVDDIPTDTVAVAPQQKVVTPIAENPSPEPFGGKPDCFGNKRLVDKIPLCDACTAYSDCFSASRKS
jgi:hypothetical protein